MGKTLKICLALFLLSFIIYNLNFSPLYTTGKGDTTPSRLLPFNLFLGHGFYFDEL